MARPGSGRAASSSRSSVASTSSACSASARPCRFPSACGPTPPGREWPCATVVALSMSPVRQRPRPQQHGKSFCRNQQHPSLMSAHRVSSAGVRRLRRGRTQPAFRHQGRRTHRVLPASACHGQSSTRTLCDDCDLCLQSCRFDAITSGDGYHGDRFACEGCALCTVLCRSSDHHGAVRGRPTRSSRTPTRRSPPRRRCTRQHIALHIPSLNSRLRLAVAQVRH